MCSALQMVFHYQITSTSLKAVQRGSVNPRPLIHRASTLPHTSHFLPETTIFQDFETIFWNQVSPSHQKLMTPDHLYSHFLRKSSCWHRCFFSLSLFLPKNFFLLLSCVAQNLADLRFQWRKWRNSSWPILIVQDKRIADDKPPGSKTPVTSFFYFVKKRKQFNCELFFASQTTHFCSTDGNVWFFVFKIWPGRKGANLG